MNFDEPVYADNSLIAGCKRNDRVAQGRFYQKYYAQAYRICNRYVSGESDVLSIMNEGFLKIFHNMTTYRPEMGNVGAWIHRIMVNTAIDHIRKLQREAPQTSLEQYDQLSLDEEAFSRLSAGEILKMIKALPPMAQAVFNLYEVEGYSHKEIAVLMNITESTSRWHLTDAKKKLRACYCDHQNYQVKVNEEKIYP